MTGMTQYGGTVAIYFIRPVDADGPVKIGHSVYPASRLVTYSSWSPVQLEIAAVIEVSVPDDEPCRRFAMRIERRFHNRYRAHWSHHEWFKPHQQLVRDIQLIRRGEFDLSVLPASGPPIRKNVDSAWHQARNAPRQKAAA